MDGRKVRMNGCAEGKKKIIPRMDGWRERTDAEDK